MNSRNKNLIKEMLSCTSIFYRYLGPRIYIIFVLTFASGLMEGFGFIILMPLFLQLGAIDTGTKNISNVSSTEVTNDLTESVFWLDQLLSFIGLGDSYIAILAAVALIFIIKSLFVFFAYGYSAVLNGRLIKDIREKIFHSYSKMQYRYYSTRHTGHFINVIHNQATGMISAFSALAGAWIQLINTVVLISISLIVAWRFGLMAIFAGIFIVIILRQLHHYVAVLSRKSSAENGNFARILVQVIHSFKYLTATAQMSPMKKIASDSIFRISDYQIRNGLVSSFTGAIREPIAVVAIVFIFGVQLFVFGQELAPILVSTLLFYRGINSAISFQNALQGMVSYLGSVEAVRDELTLQQANQEIDGDIVVGDLSREIHFSNVNFKYSNEDVYVLNDVSFTIAANSTVALIGESGAGKSTIADLLTLILRPSSGSIYIDGIKSNKIKLASWRKQIGYVSQETVIFDDTIANNICMCKGGSLLDAELMLRIKTAAEEAHISNFIESLSDGYQTSVGDRGIRLSGGQRQRLFIARELFRKPNLLILDEATSALDSESEASVQNSINQLKGRMTVVIIAHRLSTIRDVDRIFVFSQGKLIEEGGYDELRNRENSRLNELVSMQKL